MTINLILECLILGFLVSRYLMSVNSRVLTRKRWLKGDLKRIDRIIKRTPFRYEVQKLGKMQIREGVRTDYNKTKEKLDAAFVRMKAEEKKDYKDRDQKIISDMDTMQKNSQRQITAMEEQMKELEKEIAETEATCNSTVEAARAYKGLVLKLLKK